MPNQDDSKDSSKQGGYQKPQTISEAHDNPRYQGKIVIESPEGLYSTNKEENAISKMRVLRQKYSSKEITTTIIPQKNII
jgi:hypothetical protein